MYMRGIAQLAVRRGHTAVPAEWAPHALASQFLAGVHALRQGPFWFIAKILVFMFFYVIVRGTLPRFRYDQLMSFGWKFLLPVSLANLVITAFVILCEAPRMSLPFILFFMLAFVAVAGAVHADSGARADSQRALA